MRPTDDGSYHGDLVPGTVHVPVIPGTAEESSLGAIQKKVLDAKKMLGNG